jgi:hypothetical protein
LQGLPEEEYAEDGGDGKLKAGAIDEQGAPGEGDSEHRSHEVQGKELKTTKPS